ncbi:hypothetical protein SKC37_02870 [Aquirufa sp. HETE-83D]|uniref:DUF4825 domain-containing protein n=1 Tax=Aquirufa esocilacus TaxID=3096513 RepID=A0ABW6DFW3_9BACT
MKKLITILASILFTSLTLVSCDSGDKEKNFNGVQLFYTSAVTEAEADSLGSFLISSEFADGGEKTVQLNKSGTTYEFRMVVKKGIEQDQEYTELGKALASEISAGVFNGQQVDVHYCDENLNTLRVLPMSTN